MMVESNLRRRRYILQQLSPEVRFALTVETNRRLNLNDKICVYESPRTPKFWMGDL